MNVSEILQKKIELDILLAEELHRMTKAIGATGHVFRGDFATQLEIKGVYLRLPLDLDKNIGFIQAFYEAVQKGATFERRSVNHVRLHFGDNKFDIGFFPNIGRNTTEEFIDWWKAQ